MNVKIRQKIWFKIALGISKKEIMYTHKILHFRNYLISIILMPSSEWHFCQRFYRRQSVRQRKLPINARKPKSECVFRNKLKINEILVYCDITICKADSSVILINHFLTDAPPPLHLLEADSEALQK